MKIIHIDMDSFYASVEIRENPNLEGKAVAVGGLPGKRGVISTCNYEARRFGVHSALPSVTALKLCPHLILLPGNMELYKNISKEIHQIFQKYTSKIEPLSLDEAFLDVTDCKFFGGSASLIAENIRKEIFEKTKLTASAGVAPLKFLAKIASEEQKPNGQFILTSENIDDFVKTLPLKKIPGVGKVTDEKLKKLGFMTCEDIRKADRYNLLEIFGKFGQTLWNYAHCIDTREIKTERKRKSVGVEITLLKDIENIESSKEIFETLYTKLLQRIKKAGVTQREIKGIGVKLKFSDFSRTSVDHIGNDFHKEPFLKLLAEAWKRSYGLKVRLIGLKVNIVKKEETNQLILF